jgi:hypothetical protein
VRIDGQVRMQAGAMNPTEYDAAKVRYLMPYKDALIALLADAGAWREIPAPAWADVPLAGIRRTWFTNGDKTISISENEVGNADKHL